MSHSKTRLGQMILVFLIGALLISACSPASQLLGKWNADNNSEAVEFLQNDVVTMTVLGVSVNGAYKIVDDTHLQVNLLGLIGGLAGTQIFTYKISGDTLQLTLGSVATTYTRVK